MTTKHSARKLALTLTASILAACGHAQAFELNALGTNLPPVDLHGFASQGFIWNSGHNDYLGGESHNGTFDFREYGVNATTAYGKWRAGVQFFGQKLGEYGDDKVKLDWADIDYQAAQWFGLRAGRVKTPRGLYNEALDLDSTRPFVLLPQSVYDARLRDFNSSFDGGMAYGNIDLKKAGSLDYRAYGGHMSLSVNSGANDYFNNDAALANASFTMDATFGGSLFWNTPLQGLRIGYSYQGFYNLTADRIAPAFGPPPATSSIIPRGTDLYSRHLISAEYTFKQWTFAAEGGLDTAHYVITLPAGGPLPPPGSPPPPTGVGNTQDFNALYGYVSATRQITRQLQMGAYYSYSCDHLTGVAPYTFTQGDFAVSARYDFTDYLLGKVEIHYMDGSGKLFDTAAHPQPVSSRDNSWVMFDVKVTFSF